MLQVLLIGCGGFIGTIARYAVTTMVYRLLGASFPYGTMTVNILGCLLIGFVSTAAEERDMIAHSTRLYLTIGILGGGQLGRMLALSAARLGLKSHIYCPDTQSPAFDVTPCELVTAIISEKGVARAPYEPTLCSWVNA